MGLSTSGNARIQRTKDNRNRATRVDTIIARLDDEMVDEGSGLTDRAQFIAWLHDTTMSPNMVAECMVSYAAQSGLDVGLAHQTVTKWRRDHNVAEPAQS